MTVRGRIAAALAVGLAIAGGPVAAAETTGAGSTFVFPILSKWAADYAGRTGDKVNYQPIGSGAGIAQIRAATVDFGASDMPMRSEDLEKLGMDQFPLVIGGVVPVVHIEGVQPGQIRFTGPLLADIYLGKVKTWNAPAIQSVNPRTQAPQCTDISGASFRRLRHHLQLGQLSLQGEPRVEDRRRRRYRGPMAYRDRRQGQRGRRRLCESSPELDWLRRIRLCVAEQVGLRSVQNRAGQFIKPEVDSFQSAAAGVDWSNAKDFNLVMTDAPGEKAYPITATVFVIMYQTGSTPNAPR